MKSASFFAMAFVAAASLPLMAQQINATSRQQSTASAASVTASDATSENSSASAGSGAIHANGSATTAANANFGDQASAHAYEMSTVTGELQGKLNARTAKVGDAVVLKTTQKVQTADGSIIPKGTRLVGHITQVQAHDAGHAVSQLGIAFDRAELKNGQTIPVHTLIRGISPNPGIAAMNAMNNDQAMDAPMAMAAPMAAGTASAGGRSLVGGHSGGLVGGTTDMAGATLERTADSTSSVADRTSAASNADTQGLVQTAGHGDLSSAVGAHDEAAVRAIPHATDVPGVMLAGNSSASGVLSASKKNVELESGTQMQLGIVTNR